MPIALLLPLVLCPASAASQEPAPEQAPHEPWKVLTTWLREQRDGMSADLERAHERLLARAESEAPELVPRLSQTPPRPLPTGYGILPEVKDNGPVRPVSPKRRTYALERLSTGFAREFRDARMLAERARALPDAALEPEVKTFERLRKRMRDLEEHLAYHDWWQAAVVKDLDYFTKRNDLVAKVVAMRALEEAGGAPAQVAELRKEIHDGVAPFKASPRLVLEEGEDGALVLPVHVTTDIADEAFLTAFEATVRAEFNDAEAARARRFSIALEIEHVAPEELYDGAPPDRGAELDVEAHVARFPEGAIVMTTGADSTHAWQARSLLLGPSPITRRTLAHEFGHLLGFSDAYLRGYEGEPGGEFGIVLVEWTGLLDDLMGNPGGGRVTAAMVEQLIEAYRAE